MSTALTWLAVLPAALATPPEPLAAGPLALLVASAIRVRNGDSAAQLAPTPTCCRSAQLNCWAQWAKPCRNSITSAS